MATQQWWFAHKVTVPVIGLGTVFVPVADGATGASGLGQTGLMPCAAAGAVRQIIVRCTAAPGVGNSWRFRFRVNAVASSSIDVTISGAQTYGTVTGSEAVALWDDVDTSITPAGTPTAGVQADVWLLWEPTTANEFVYFCGDTIGLVSGAPPLFWPALNGAGTGNGGVSATDNAEHRVAVPFAATITRYAVRMSTAPGATHSRSFRLSINSVENAASDIVVSGAATKGNVAGLAIALAALDSVASKEYAAVAPANTRGLNFSVCMVPTVAGNFLIGGSTDAGGYSTTVARYYDTMQQNSSDWNAAEAGQQVQIEPPVMVLTGFAIEFTTVPAAGRTHTITHRKNGANDGLSVLITSASATKRLSSGASVRLVAGDLVNIQETPAGVPANPGLANWALWFGPVTTQRLRTRTGFGQ